MDLLEAFFDGWEGVIEIILVAPIMYVAVILAIRITGKRATSQMNNFDWIVTVAIGALTASGIVIDSVSFVEAITAIAILLGAQYLLTSRILFSKRLARLVKARPTLLVHKGELIHDALRQERVTPSEVMSAVRENGLIDLEEVQWVILETDATLSVIPKDDRDFSNASFQDVSGFPRKD